MQINICENGLHLSIKRALLHSVCAVLALGFNSICEMDYLPKDPAILVSSVNMLLRDEEFDTLESLCYAFNKEPRDIKDYLYKRGFVWSEQQKQFRPIGYDQ